MMIARIVLTIAAVFGISHASAGDINGLWQHSEEPGWIEINLDEAKGTVVRNDKFPDRVGREILKDLKADADEENLWHGQVYAERLGEYKTAEISLAEPNLMKFRVKAGLISRTVEWVRVDSASLLPGPVD